MPQAHRPQASLLGFHENVLKSFPVKHWTPGRPPFYIWHPAMAPSFRREVAVEEAAVHPLDWPPASGLHDARSNGEDCLPDWIGSLICPTAMSLSGLRNWKRCIESVLGVARSVAPGHHAPSVVFTWHSWTWKKIEFSSMRRLSGLSYADY